MIYHRLFWFAALFTGVANFILFVSSPSLFCGLSMLVCGVVCGILYENTWRK